MRLAVTGGVGSGKSAVLSILRDLGARSLSLDDIYRRLTLTNASLTDKIRAAFPECSCDSRIDWAALGSLVFSDGHARRQLNRISHPLIMQALADAMDAAAPGETVAVEVPLLVEGGYGLWFDRIISVWCPQEIRIQRLVCRGMSAPDALSRCNIQAEERLRLLFADFIIDNSRELHQTKDDTIRVWSSITGSAGECDHMGIIRSG